MSRFLPTIGVILALVLITIATIRADALLRAQWPTIDPAPTAETVTIP